nr:atp-dependent dna helicase like recg, chloroplastic [Quercus suber]
MRSEGHFEMREYNIDVIQEEQDSSFQAKGRPYPIYPSKGGINPIFLRDTIARALQALPVNIDPIPKDITQDFKLLTLHDAYIGIHQPKNINEADLARKRLIFDEFFYLQLGRLYQMLEGLGTKIEKDDLLDRYRKPELNSIYMEEWSSLTKKFLKALPYSLTSSQLNAVSEIIWDLKRPIPMNRLLQGDVGCGKTVVAFLACMEVIGSGYQGAFMVPSELLAIQHYEHLLNLLEKMEEGLQTGNISLVIGTHSLIAEKVEFSALRIAVVDEQHRFGVIQRGSYSLQLYYTSESSRMGANNLDEPSKGDEYMAPHVLAMSATPIPRTLALALYGDMSLTQICLVHAEDVSRGIRASYSFSFLEVVVGCEIAENQSNPEHTADDVGRKEKKTIYLHLKKFFRGSRFTFQPFLKSLEAKHKEGEVVCVSGKVRSMRSEGHFEMREYNIDVIQEEQDSSFRAKGRPYPIYPSKGGINPIFLRDTIARALKALPVNIDPIPKDITQDFKLLTLHDAYIGIHQPKNINEADLARKRLIFDEFFYLQLGRLYQMLEGLGTKIEKDGLLDRYRKPELNSVYMEEWSSLTKKFLKALPYSLTSSQLNAVSEIIWDLKRPIPMNRLLQGDVGCGKTVVAFLACMEVIGSGYQGAFMVPSELLAIQHYEHLLNLLEKMEEVECKPSVVLLTGSTPSKQSRMIREGLQTGNISLVIGTHSLIAEKVEFSALRIAVVDEQHRFGVIQRGRFNSKLYYTSESSRMGANNLDGPSKGDEYMAPHVLAMSATPIPRTLALALYGDMSLTQITDLPPGRIPVETFIIEGNDDGFENVYKMMLDELEVEGKVYLVYPVIEPSEQLPQLRAASADLEVISQRFQGYSCGLLHGKMKSDEKEEALRRFRSGETRILLSTQVIEIGVDVPDASMMVVMNAERFGIAQLHQLRGRVGRGERKSKCMLLASTTSGLNRLKVLGKSSDGFYLANVDLLLRGPGDLLGKKQSGHLPEFPIARLEIDGNILQDAHLAALVRVNLNRADLARAMRLPFPVKKSSIGFGELARVGEGDWVCE